MRLLLFELSWLPPILIVSSVALNPALQSTAPLLARRLTRANLSKLVYMMASPASVADPPTELARRSDADSLRVRLIAGYRRQSWHTFQPADI